MNKFLRNCMTAGVFALGLAACGDDVTVTQPPAPPAVPNITSFSVAPAAVTLTVGQVVQASYNLQLAPGLTGTVAYISGTSSVATIDATGKITAVAVGTSVVTATATSGGQTSVATIGVTVIAAPVVDAIQDFTVSPTSVTMIAGTTTQASYNLQLAPGLSGAVAWGPSTVPGVATINASGVITAVAPGTTSIPVTATSAGQTSTVTIGVTVVAVTPASISIASVTQGLLTLPVNLSNVNGQIEINLNFDPGGQQIDSVVSYIGTKRAAVQSFSPSATPTAGVISMSVNTANFKKNFNQAGVATAGATQVDFLNGPTTVNAIVYPKATTGQSAGNCTNAPPGVPAVCSSNTFSIVLNNMDSWAADMTAPTATALAAATSFAPGQTFWGGPTATGVVSSTLYPVIYTPGRSITTVTWTIGGCGAVVQTALPFTQSFGYVAPAQTSCVGYEWAGGIRDNLLVAVAIDNAANVYGPFAGLIPNTVVFNSTPDSLRLDYAAPSVGTPSIVRAAPAVTGWINAAFNFVNFASGDVGVGLRTTRDRAVWYNSINCPTVVAAGAPMGTGTGADINATVACPTNFIGGAAGLGGTAPWTVYGTESDRLANVGTSSDTPTFGTDYTAPSLRWGLVDAAYPLLRAVHFAGTPDTIFTLAKPTTQVFRGEFLDERSGFSATADRHALSLANHANNLGTCLVGTGTPGATFVTAATCGMVVTAFPVATRVDGWQPGPDVLVPTAEGYYFYRTQVTDAAGNASAIVSRRLLVNTNAPFATGLGVPAVLTASIFNFLATYADSAEVINNSLAVTYPEVPTDPDLRYPQTAIGAAFDDVITSPFAGNIAPPTGAPYVRSLEAVVAGAFPASNVNGVYPVTPKPTFVQAWSFNPSNFFSASPLIAIPALNVQDGLGVAAYNTANPTMTVGHWRVISTVATTNQFGSITPLRAHTTAPISSSVNTPFARVDFYRLDAGGTWWNYLGSDATGQLTDVFPNRSWLYDLPNASFAKNWNGAANGVVAAGNVIIAVGVLANGDAIVTAATTMVP